jgi:hypothetical protein
MQHDNTNVVTYTCTIQRWNTKVYDPLGIFYVHLFFFEQLELDSTSEDQFCPALGRVARSHRDAYTRLPRALSIALLFNISTVQKALVAIGVAIFAAYRCENSGTHAIFGACTHMVLNWPRKQRFSCSTSGTVWAWNGTMMGLISSVLTKAVSFLLVQIELKA